MADGYTRPRYEVMTAAHGTDRVRAVFVEDADEIVTAAVYMDFS
jgi:hypothetical protein